MYNNLGKVSEHYGFVPNYFYVVKSVSRTKFDYIYNLDKSNFQNAYSIYLNEMDKLKNQMIDMYYELYDNRLIHKFGKYVYKHNFYTNINSLSCVLPKVLFSSQNGFKVHKTYIKYKEMPYLYEQFKKDQLLIHKKQLEN